MKPDKLNSPRSRVAGSSRLIREQRAGKELAVLLLVEPSAFDVKQPEAGEPRERERIDRELRDRLVGAGVRLVIEDVHGAVADLQEIDVAGEDAGLVAFGQESDAVLRLQRVDIRSREPDWNFDRDRHAVVGEHEAL